MLSVELRLKLWILNEIFQNKNSEIIVFLKIKDLENEEYFLFFQNGCIKIKNFKNIDS